MFLSFTSSQVVYVNATACLQNDKIYFLAHLIQRRWDPNIVLCTDGQEQVIEDRSWLLLPLPIPPKTIRACVGPRSLMPKTNCKGGDVLGECYIDLRWCDYPVPPSVCSCVLDEPVFFATSSFDAVKVCVQTMCCFWLVGPSTWNPGYMGSIFWRCFVCERTRGFSVRTCLIVDNFVSAWLVLHVYVLDDAPAFGIVLF